MTRRQLRENVFQLLFRMEFHDTEELTEQLALFDEEFSQMSEADKDYRKMQSNYRDDSGA